MKVRDLGDETTMSYSELRDRARALARALERAAPATERPRVSVLAPNGWSVLVAHFAAALCGGVVGNHNAHLTPSELAFQLERFEPHVVLAGTDALETTLRDALALVPESNPRVLRAPGGLPSARSPDDTSPGVDAFDAFEFAPEDPYMLYFTSGTSGKPKGVMLTQNIVCRHAVGTIAEMRLCSRDVWFHAAPMFHLVDAFAVYAVTAVGGTHVLRPTFDAAVALGTIETEGVTVFNVASTMVALMCANPAIARADLTSMRLLSCGGSPLAEALARRATSVFGCEFFLSYGMTECCGKISMSMLEPELRAAPLARQMAVACTSGRPFRLQTVRVVGEDGALVARGAAPWARFSVEDPPSSKDTGATPTRRRGRSTGIGSRLATSPRSTRTDTSPSWTARRT